MSSIIQTSADLYSVSVTHWNAIQSLSNSLAATSVIHWAQISSVSADVNTLSQTVDALSTDVNNLLALASGLNTVSSAIATLSSSIAGTSSVQWAAISSISNRAQVTSVQQWAAISSVSQQIANASLSIASLSGAVNATSIVHWTAISNVSSTTTATSIAHWTAFTSLSNSLNTTSAQQWAAIQSVLPSVTGQAGKYLQATPTGTQWTSVGTGGGGGGVGYTTMSTALSVYTAAVPTGDVVVILQNPSATVLSVILPQSLSDGQTMVIKKGPSTISTAIVNVTASAGTLIDGVATPVSVKATLGFVALTYSDKISAYVTTAQKWTDGGGLDPSVPFTCAFRISPLAGGTNGQINSNYGSLSGALGVTFNGLSAASFSVQNASQIFVTVAPSTTPGIGDITIYDSVGVSRSVTNYFEYRAYYNQTGTQIQNAGAQITIAENGRMYMFNSDSPNESMHYGVNKNYVGPVTSFGVGNPRGPPLCERLSGQVVLVPQTTPGFPYRYSTDGGANFSTSSGITGASKFAVSPNGTYVLAIKSGAGFWYGSNIATGNITFTQSPSFSTVTVQDMCVNDAGTGVGVVKGMSLMQTTDGGATWTQPVGAPAGDWTSCAIGGNVAFVCGRFTGVYRSTDGGATWTLVAGLSADLVYPSVSCSQTGKYVVVATNRASVFVSTDFGATFIEKFDTAIASTANVQAVAMATDGGYLLVAGGLRGYLSNL